MREAAPPAVSGQPGADYSPLTRWCLLLFPPERAAKVVEQQERLIQQQQGAAPRTGTPVGALVGVVPPPTPMGVLNQHMTPASGNPSRTQRHVVGDHGVGIGSRTAHLAPSLLSYIRI